MLLWSDWYSEQDIVHHLSNVVILLLRLSLLRVVNMDGRTLYEYTEEQWVAKFGDQGYTIYNDLNTSIYGWVI